MAPDQRIVSSPSCSLPPGKKWYSEPNGALAKVTICLTPVPAKPWRRNSSALVCTIRSLVGGAIPVMIRSCARAIYLVMPELELTAGTIDYEDSGGEGPVVLLLGGVVMDGSVWAPLVEDLRREHRCVVPTLPLAGFARMVQEIMIALDLHDVTLVQNDHAAALVLAGQRPERVARLVISSCEAFENYPPGLPGKNLRLTALVPGGLYVAMQGMRSHA